MMVQGVILDVDGTLVLSNNAQSEAWVEAFSAYGYDISVDQVRPFIGMGGDQVVPRLVPGLNGEEGTGKQIVERRKELIINKLGTDLSPANGARNLVQKMRSDGLKLIIASSATDQEMNLLLNAAQMNDLVSEFTTSSDVEAAKPESDIVEAALSKANLSRDRALMLGDTPYDIASAEKAGVGVIAFRTGGFSDRELQGAIAIYDDPADLLLHYETSPLASDDYNSFGNNIAAKAESMLSDASSNAETATDAATQAWQSFQVKANHFLTNATSSIGAFVRNNQSLFGALGWVLLALLGIKVLFTTLDVIDDIPLISPLLKLIGLVYSGWFVWRYLLRAHNRQELAQTIKQAKADLFGSSI
jgi:phosphoglycolate phosphatase-like HAD superfamily hydrolase